MIILFSNVIIHYRVFNRGHVRSINRCIIGDTCEQEPLSEAALLYILYVSPQIAGKKREKRKRDKLLPQFCSIFSSYSVHRCTYTLRFSSLLHFRLYRSLFITLAKTTYTYIYIYMYIGRTKS